MKLSIIVPVYNTEIWLSGCLDSLLCHEAETGEYEIIAVNDGSTDSCEKILKEYEQQNPDVIRVITTPNGGLGHARNTGIEAAAGEYLVFIDSDDRLETGSVEEMLQIIGTSSGSFDIAVFDIVHVDENGRHLRRLAGYDREAAPHPAESRNHSEQRLSMPELFSLEECPTFLFAPHNAVNKIWRSELFKDTGIRFPDRLWFEDLATIPKLCLHAEKIRIIPKPWYLYLQRQGSIMLSGSNVSRNREMILVAESVVDYYREYGRYDRFAPELEYKFFYEEYLSALVRVSLGDPKSPVQAELRDDYLKRFPGYRNNPYYRAAPIRYHLLDHVIRAGKWRAVQRMMEMNNQIKRKKGPSR